MGRQAEGPRPAWGSLALAAAVLSSCFLLTQAQEIPVLGEPSQLLQGEDITLTPGGDPEILVCVWFREADKEENRVLTYIIETSTQRNGPRSSGRESSGPLCILHIKSLMLNDTGNYVVQKILLNGRGEMGRAYIDVLDPLVPEVSKGAIAVIGIGTLAGAVLLAFLL